LEYFTINLHKKAHNTMTTLRTTAATVASALLTLGACGNDSEENRVGATVPPGSPPEATTIPARPTTTAPPTPDDAVTQYFDLLATADLSRMGGMLEVAAEDSPAHLYATHQIALVRASSQLVRRPSATSTWAGNDSVEQCIDGYDDITGEAIEECTVFADFEQVDEHLTSFTVDGQPISERISSGEAAEADGVSVRVVTAYQTSAGDLFLNVDITNNRDGRLIVEEYDWVLITADGRQVESDPMASGLTSDIEPDATAATTAVFLQTSLGGTLRFVAFSDDFETQIRFEVPIPGGE
jgi:hypothetical protein